MEEIMKLAEGLAHMVTYGSVDLKFRSKNVEGDTFSTTFDLKDSEDNDPLFSALYFCDELVYASKMMNVAEIITNDEDRTVIIKMNKKRISNILDGGLFITTILRILADYEMLTVRLVMRHIARIIDDEIHKKEFGGYAILDSDAFIKSNTGDYVEVKIEGGKENAQEIYNSYIHHDNLLFGDVNYAQGRKCSTFKLHPSLNGILSFLEVHKHLTVDIKTLEFTNINDVNKALNHYFKGGGVEELTELLNQEK